MPEVGINWLAIIMVVVVNMALGAIWYSPLLFGKTWAGLLGKKASDRGNARTDYIVSAVSALIQAWILVHFVRYAGAITAIKGLEVGFWLWLAFTGLVIAINTMLEGRRWKLSAINAGYFLAVLMINGAILAAWR
jgi:hypothetical protein